MLATCQRLLRAPDFGVTDNFFDAGGHSLLAMTLLLEIEKQTDLEISLESIFSKPTVRDICASLRKRRQHEPAVIWPIRPGSPQQTLYFMHGAFQYAAINDALASELSISLVTVNDAKWLRQLMAADDIVGAIDRISDAYAQAIAAKRPIGSLYLAGHSFGGILAVETACRLEALGIAPDAVFLLDTYLHGAWHRVVYDILHNGLLTRKIRDALGRDRSELIKQAWSPIRAALSPRTQRNALNNLEMDSEAEIRVMLAKLRDDASRIYRGPRRALTTPTVLFRATKSLGGRTMRLDPDLGWGRHIGAGLTVIPTPGDHFEMLKEDGAQSIAAEINRRIGLPRARN